MDDNELTIYILQQLRQGVPEQSIRTVLAQNGWPQPLVDRAFSMVQQARPHPVEPQITTGPVLAQPREGELPAPSERTYSVLESEKKREQQSVLRRVLTGLMVLAVLAAIGGAVYYFVLRDKPAVKESGKSSGSSIVDAERREAVNGLAGKLWDYYKNKSTYPTLAQINAPDFPHTSGGFDSSKYKDPKWDSKKSACASAQGKVILAETRSDGCITYRSTASNGGDCDASASPCTRVVMTVTLDNKKPFIVALDHNERE